METPPFQDTRKVFAIWAIAWLAAFGLGVVGNVGFARYAAHMRAHDPRAFLREAERLMNRNEVAAALAQLDEVERRAPEAPESYRLRGACRMKLKQWELALDAFQKALDRGSRNEDMMLKKISVLLQLRRFQEAITFGEQCLSQGYSYKAFYLYLGDAYRGLGKDAESVPYYEKAVAAYGNEIFVMERLEQAYRRAGKTDDAEALRARINESQAALEQTAP